MKAEVNIDTSELEGRIARKVLESLKPLFKTLEEEPALFTVKSLAEYLAVSEKWVYERVQFKEIPYYKVGGSLRFKKAAVDRWLEDECKTPAVNPLHNPHKVAKICVKAR